MSNNLEVTPEALRAAANHLSSAGDNLAGVLSSLQSALAGEGAPWGGDDTGTQFATGGDGGGYLGQLQSVADAITAKVDLLNAYAEGMTITATSLERADQV